MTHFDIEKLRKSPKEQLRIADLMSLTPRGERILEIGARDCYLSRLLRDRYKEVVALDLEQPQIDEPGITPVRGDVTALAFPDRAFDTVFCTEVLEHIAPEKLQQACDELMRVSAHYLVIGVPYKQDLRYNRLKCDQCGSLNPTSGHLNRFDTERLLALLASAKVRDIRYVGYGEGTTNPLSDWLYRCCGYPYGSYQQEEGCIRCGAKLERPAINALQWGVCFVARGLNALQNRFGRSSRPNWIHILFEVSA